MLRCLQPRPKARRPNGGARLRRGQAETTSWILRHYGAAVAGGPFAGMAYPVAPGIDGAVPAKLLGLYERELGDVVERLVARRPGRIVDVGCGSGYYLTGLARRLPDAEAWGFDGDPAAVAAARHVARVNGVASRVRLEARICPAQELDRLATPGALVLVDIEGHEDELLDPFTVPALRDATLLVEVHDFLQPAVSSRLAYRFADTHRLEVVHAEPLRHVRHPAARAVPRLLRRWIDDQRPDGVRWALLTSLGHHNS